MNYRLLKKRVNHIHVNRDISNSKGQQKLKMLRCTIARSQKYNYLIPNPAEKLISTVRQRQVLRRPAASLWQVRGGDSRSEASRPRADWGSAGKMERAEEDDQKTAHWLLGPFAWERKSRWINNERWRWWGSCNVTSLSKY